MHADAVGVDIGLRCEPARAQDLVGQLDLAQTAVDRRLKARATTGAAAVVELKDDVACARQNLRERATAPAIEDALHAGSPVDLDEGGIAAFGLEVRRQKESVVQGLPVARGEGAEGRHRVIGEIGRIGMRAIEAVLQQKLDESPLQVAQADLQWLLAAAELIDVKARLRSERHRMQTVLARDAQHLVRIGCLERGAVKMPLGGTLLGGGEVHPAVALIDALDGAAM